MADATTGSSNELVAEELRSALSGTWSRYTGERPASSSFQLSGDTLRWTIGDGAERFEGPASDEDDEEARETMTASAYVRETSAAVSKASGRRVSGRMRKCDKKSGDVVETFILEPRHVRL